MLSKLFSCVNIGLESSLVEVEVDVGKGFPGFTIVGLPDKAVSESAERVKSAIINSDLHFPAQNRVIINLAPADIKKEGAIYDLPIAVGILFACEQLKLDLLPKNSLFIGELALNGDLRHTKGVLPMAIFAKAHSLTNVFLPRLNLAEGQLVKGVNFYPLDSLSALVEHLTGQKPIIAARGSGAVLVKQRHTDADMCYIRGQEQVKRALEIAAAGGHNVLMSGPPGTGKTLLARAFVSILPKMTNSEILEVTKIYSVDGLLPANSPLITARPFRAPHHTISDVALVGGGQYPKPGEISLAHRGVLFLDEFSEFSRNVLEALRQPLEDGIVTVSRAKRSVIYPARFILIAAQNPCPCGHFGDKEKNCVCAPSQILRYRKKISGPLLDRIDLQVMVPRISFAQLTGEQITEPSKAIRARVEAARQRQRLRFGKNILCNAEMTNQHLKQFVRPDAEALKLLQQAVDNYKLSARAYFRLLRISRTIADLAGMPDILPQHIAEAISYRAQAQEEIIY